MIEVEQKINTLPQVEARDVFIDGVKAEGFKAVCVVGAKQPLKIFSDKYVIIQHATAFNKVLGGLSKHG